MGTLPAVCERTAQYVSLDLDGELSRFERALLDRHLRTCKRCAAYAVAVVELTTCLRAAPLEPISAPIVVTRPGRRVGLVVQRTVAATAVAVLAVWLGMSSSDRTLVPGPAVTSNPSDAATAASDGRYDWPAGLPHSPHLTQLIPGGLYTSAIDF